MPDSGNLVAVCVFLFLPSLPLKHLSGSIKGAAELEGVAESEGAAESEGVAEFEEDGMAGPKSCGAISGTESHPPCLSFKQARPLDWQPQGGGI